MKPQYTKPTVTVVPPTSPVYRLWSYWWGWHRHLRPAAELIRNAKGASSPS